MNNNSKKEKLHFSLGIGSASILIIFVILCLVSFATLSVCSANADLKLSTKVLSRNTAYYEAVDKAEHMLAQLDNTLIKVYSSALNEEEYFATVGRNKSFLIPISDLQSLEINVTIQYPRKSDDTFYVVDCFHVIITGELDYDESLPVLQ